MPKLDDVLPLITAIATQNQESARRAIQVMITHEAEQGNTRAAKTLQQALDRWPSVPSLPVLPNEIAALCWSPHSSRALESLTLAPATLHGLQRFLEERAQAADLRAATLPVSHRLLFTGPPGNGKTSTATAVATAVGLPLVAAKLSAVVDAYLGSTSRHLARLFDYAAATPIVLVLDEVDTLGSRRDARDMTQEYRTILTGLLTAIDHLPDTSILIAATNRPDLLDPALLRRFDQTLNFPPPARADIHHYLEHYQTTQDVTFPITPDSLATALAGSAWYAIEQVCQSLHKQRVLEMAANNPGKEVDGGLSSTSVVLKSDLLKGG